MNHVENVVIENDFTCGQCQTIQIAMTESYDIVGLLVVGVIRTQNKTHKEARQ